MTIGNLLPQGELVRVFDNCCYADRHFEVLKTIPDFWVCDSPGSYEIELLVSSGCLRELHFKTMSPVVLKEDCYWINTPH